MKLKIPMFLYTVFLTLTLYVRYAFADSSGRAFIYPASPESVDEYFVAGAIMAGIIVSVVVFAVLYMRYATSGTVE